MTRVLVVGDASSTHVHRLVESLESSRLDISLAAFEGPAMPGVRMHRLGSLPPEADRRYVLAIPRLAALMKRLRPDVVNAHYLTSFGVMTALALPMAFPIGARPATVQTVWGDDLLVAPAKSRVHRFLARFALRQAAAVTGDSQDLREATGVLAPRAPWTTFLFGPPASLLDERPTKEHLIFSPRHLVPEKRVDLIVRAFQLARRSYPLTLGDWRLVVAGEGSAEPEVRRAIDEDPDGIEFVGVIPLGEMRSILLRSSVMVSIPTHDATSATLLDALAAGAAPIVNDLPANREWVDSEVGVVTVRNPTVDSLSEAIQLATTSTFDIDRMRSRVRDATWERQIQILVDVLENVARGT